MNTLPRAWGLLVFLVLVLIGYLNAVIISQNVQAVIPHIDAFMHLLGGAWAGFWVTWLLWRRGWLADPREGSGAPHILIVPAVFIIGVGWEFFEVVVSWLSNGVWWCDVLDTTGDLVCDVLGAGLAGIIYAMWTHPKKEI